VLPLNGKTPLGGHGLTHATRDIDRIRVWWRRWPWANIGVRTDDLCVVDVDGETGEASLAELEQQLGQLPATRAQLTGKGRHLLYRADLQSNSTRQLGKPAGVDLRCGRRGYIVAAPSVHPSGRQYRWVNPDTPVHGLPATWLEALRSRETVANGSTAPTAASVRPDSWPNQSTAYGRVALNSELERLVAARLGERNETLNLAVYRLAQLVAGSELALAELEHEAAMVASLLGLPALEAQKTIRSAVAAGLRCPRRRQTKAPYIHARGRAPMEVVTRGNESYSTRCVERSWLAGRSSDSSSYSRAPARENEASA
jgi:hypothetical protein